MTFAAKDRTADLGMERNLVVLAAIVADDVKPFSIIICRSSFLASTFCATLGSHHVALVEHLLLLFGKHEDLFTLHTRNFYVRHRSSPLAKNKSVIKGMRAV